VLPRVAALLAPGGWVVALVKPQFEAGRADADRGAGIISDPAVHRRVLRELLAKLQAAGAAPAADGPRLAAGALVPSPITGREGNREYLLWLVASERDEHTAPGGGALGEEEIAAVVAEAFGQSPTNPSPAGTAGER
jgi:predicted rRNA methylase YqxC with S4 and FtsJ domains